MMKAEKGSEIITTICEYENSVAMPDNERLTYLDTCGIARLKDGNGNVKAQEAYANRCSEYLRFGHEVDLAACGAYSPYDALKVCDTPEIFLKTGFEQRPISRLDFCALAMNAFAVVLLAIVLLLFVQNRICKQLNWGDHMALRVVLRHGHTSCGGT